jgi:hypothetical protein
MGRIKLTNNLNKKELLMLIEKVKTKFDSKAIDGIEKLQIEDMRLRLIEVETELYDSYDRMEVLNYFNKIYEINT